MSNETDKVQRVIVWFSCGAASAVAAHKAVLKYGDRVSVVYCNTSASEHPDNVRFREDVERWIKTPIAIIGSTKFKTVDEVFEDRRYLAGIKGAPCTVEMKKKPRFSFQYPDDINIFGLTADEGVRIEEFSQRNPELYLEWILKDNQISKSDCFEILQQTGIEMPVRYKQGFKNNNCICCVKATSLQCWVLERRLNPDVFARRAEQSRRFGARLVRLNGERIFLDEIPPDNQLQARFLKPPTENISCGPECGVQLNLFEV